MTTRKVVLIISLGVVLIWELLFYLGIIDSSRFSHPLGTIEAFRNLDFLLAFGKTLFDVFLASLLGVAIGLVLTVLISQSSWLIQTAIRLFRLGLWAPFFIFWGIPNWLFPTAVAAVSLFTCYRFLSIRMGNSWPLRNGIGEVHRQAILHALLFYLLFQIWSVNGWMSLGVSKVDTAYAILVLLLLFVFFLDRLFRSNFPTVAETRGTVLVKEIASRRRSSFWGVGFLIIVCLAAWQLLSDQILRHFRVGSPLAVLDTLYPLLAAGEVFFDIGVSLLEVLAGLVLGGGVAVFIFHNMSHRAPFRNVMFAFLPLTFIVPIMFRLVEINWMGWDVSSWRTALDVGLLTFYPFVLVLWGLRNSPLVCQILLAADNTLPYAFLAMLFGEQVASSKGLGFYIAWTRAISSIDRSLGGALLTFGLLVLLSFILRSTAKRLYFAESSELQRAAWNQSETPLP